MKILIISTGILPQPAVKGGAVESLIDTIIQYNEKNKEHNISIYSVYDKDAIKQAKKYNKCEFNYIKINKLITQLFKMNIIPVSIILKIFMIKVVNRIKNMNENQFDVILIENEFKFASKLKSVSYNKPIILHLHNDYINKEVKGVTNKIKIFDLIITVSDFIKNRIQEVDRTINVHTVHNGIEMKLFKKIDGDERKRLRHKYNINDNDCVVVFAGRLVKEKGIKELLMAFREIPKNMNIKMLVIGDTFFNSKKEDKFSKELKVLANNDRERIIFTGFIDNKDIAKFYSLGDIGCVPSTWNEPFGLTVIEQMSIGLPLIVSNSGAIPEIVNDSCSIMINLDHEFVLNLRKAIITLYENPILRTKMGEQSKKISERFSSDIFAHNVYEVLEQTIKC